MPGYAKDKEAVQGRLRRIEGQVRGLQRMVDEDRYCIDVLTQINAVRAALESVALVLLHDHTEHCVADAIRAGEGTPKVRELSEAVERLGRGWHGHARGGRAPLPGAHLRRPGRAAPGDKSPGPGGPGL